MRHFKTAICLILCAMLSQMAAAQEGPEVTGVYLVDTESSRDIDFIDNDDRIDISAYQEEQLSIRVEVAGSPSSVDLLLQSTTGLLNIERSTTDREPPYSLCGDKNGALAFGAPAHVFSPCSSDLSHNGVYTITVTPYDGGVAGDSFSRTFRLSGSPIRQLPPEDGAPTPPSSGCVKREGRSYCIPTEACARGELRKPRLGPDGAYLYEPCPDDEGYNNGCIYVCISWKTMLCTPDHFCIDP